MNFKCVDCGKRFNFWNILALSTRSPFGITCNSCSAILQVPLWVYYSGSLTASVVGVAILIGVVNAAFSLAEKALPRTVFLLGALIFASVCALWIYVMIVMVLLPSVRRRND